jgi:hypothetical protein
MLRFKVQLESAAADLAEFREYLSKMAIVEDSDERIDGPNGHPICIYRGGWDALRSMITDWWHDSDLHEFITEDHDWETNPGDSPEYWELGGISKTSPESDLP